MYIFKVVNLLLIVFIINAPPNFCILYFCITTKVLSGIEHIEITIILKASEEFARILCICQEFLSHMKD